jgi:hypothetical protein
MRQRNRREAKALANMRLRLDASALDIGTAALHGEPRASTVPRKARASMGLSIAVELVRRGVAEPTRDNRFTCRSFATCDGMQGAFKAQGRAHARL